MLHKSMRKAHRQVQDAEELRSILNKCDVCRLALFDGEYPYIVPLNYGFDFGAELILYFHCAKEGKKLELLQKNPKVCFEMDCNHQLKTGDMACDYSMNYESIIGWGEITLLQEEAQKRKGLDCLMRHYGREQRMDYRPEILSMTTVLQLRVCHFTGKRLNK